MQEKKFLFTVITNWSFTVRGFGQLLLSLSYLFFSSGWENAPEETLAVICVNKTIMKTYRNMNENNFTIDEGKKESKNIKNNDFMKRILFLLKMSRTTMQKISAKINIRFQLSFLTYVISF